MDISIPIIFFIIAVLFFILGLYEERQEKTSVDDEEESDNMVVIFFVIALICFAVGGITMWAVTQVYYSPVTDNIAETYMDEYRPLGWVGIGMAIITALLLVAKVFDILGKISEEI